MPSVLLQVMHPRHMVLMSGWQYQHSPALWFQRVCSAILPHMLRGCANRGSSGSPEWVESSVTSSGSVLSLAAPSVPTSTRRAHQKGCTVISTRRLAWWTCWLLGVLRMAAGLIQCLTLRALHEGCTVATIGRQAWWISSAHAVHTPVAPNTQLSTWRTWKEVSTVSLTCLIRWWMWGINVVGKRVVGYAHLSIWLVRGGAAFALSMLKMGWWMWLAKRARCLRARQSRLMACLDLRTEAFVFFTKRKGWLPVDGWRSTSQFPRTVHKTRNMTQFERVLTLVHIEHAECSHAEF